MGDEERVRVNLTEEGEGLDGSGVELASAEAVFARKKFFFDLKENKRGRFLRIVESDAGSKSKVILPMSAAARVKDIVTTFIAKDKELGPVSETPKEGEGEQGQYAFALSSESLKAENKRFFFDLRANARGRFMKVTSTVSGGARSTILVPVSGLEEFLSILVRFMNEGARTTYTCGNLPSKTLRHGQKRFFFDVGENNFGSFMRLSEVAGNNRSSVTIPMSAWKGVRDAIDDYIRQVGAAATEGPSATVNSAEDGAADE